MILLDTNILSTFGIIGKLELLFKIFRNGPICISPNVLFEIKKAHSFGYSYASSVLKLIEDEKIVLISITETELLLSYELPSSFGLGERDSIVIAKQRNFVFVTNEKKIINYCNREKIVCLQLNKLLRYLFIEGIMDKENINDLINDIESKDKLKIKNKEEIFRDYSKEL